MRIEEDIKLDFKDVLIRPKRSTLSSRREVDITRDFKFKWSGSSYNGIPIIAANMDGVGTIEMAKAFAAREEGMTAALHSSPEATRSPSPVNTTTGTPQPNRLSRFAIASGTWLSPAFPLGTTSTRSSTVRPGHSTRSIQRSPTTDSRATAMAETRF